MEIDTGQTSRLEPPRKDWDLGVAAASRAGNRFVVLVNEEKGEYSALDISGHSVLKGLLVFDSAFDAHPSLFIVRDSRIRNGNTVALSPDGHHLAVLGYPDPVVEIFELP